MTQDIKDITAIILAGGLGTRLRSAVSDVPKPMAPINNRPFLEYQLDHLQQAGVKKVILAIGYMAESIQHHFGNQWQDIQINYSQEEAPLGTGGAIIKAIKMMADDDLVFVMNGDTYFPISLTNMLKHHQSKKASISIAMFESEDIDRYSPFNITKDMRITSKDHGAINLKSGGIYIFSQDIVHCLRNMPIQKTSFETELTPRFLAENRSMIAYTEPCYFIDIGIPDDYIRAAEYIGVSDRNNSNSADQE